MLEKVLCCTNSSGYGFLFSLKHLNFFIACVEADKNLADPLKRVTCNGSSTHISAIRKGAGKIISDQFLMEKERHLSDINALIFQYIRIAFRLLDKGSLADDETAINDLIIHENCDVVIG